MHPHKITDFHWDEANERSATKHGYSRQQIESAFNSRTRIFRGKGEAYIALGQDMDRNYLEMAFENLGNGCIRVFHCDTMKPAHRRQFERK